MTDKTIPEPLGTMVAGDRMRFSLREFVHRVETLLAEEQERVMPNTALIDMLCESVRLARENAERVERREPTASGEDQSAKFARAMAVVDWCIGYEQREQRYRYIHGLAAVLEQAGFIDRDGRRKDHA